MAWIMLEASRTTSVTAMQASTFSFTPGIAGANTARTIRRRSRVKFASGRLATGVSINAALPVRDTDRNGVSGNNLVLGAVLLVGVAAIHLGVLHWVDRPQKDAFITPPAPPITIQITRPPPPPPPPVPKIEPPKALPQTPKPVVRHVARPTPAPRPTQTPPVIQAPAPSPVPSPVAATPAPPVSTAPTAPPTPAAAPVEHVTEAHGRAGYLHNPAPRYPDAAQERNWQGRVLLKVHVLADGHADSVTVAQSSGHQILDDSAVKTVTTWLFMPAKRGDTPIDGWANVPIDFKL